MSPGRDWSEETLKDQVQFPVVHQIELELDVRKYY